MFYLDPNTQKRYTIGTPFEYNGVYYTMQGATHAKFIELGFTQVLTQQRPDSQYYIVTGPDATGAYTSTPRPASELKTNFALEQKRLAHQMLRRTDWYVIRLLELGAVSAPVPTVVTTYRAAIRAAADARCAQINAAADTAALETLMKAPEELYNVATETYSVNPAALQKWPAPLAAEYEIYS